jgi:hypothetical protein
MSKKTRFHAGKVWWEALSDFLNELHEHVEKAKKDQLRFQDRRLLGSLVKHIKAKATGWDEWVAMFALYQFVTNTSQHLGYDEALRLHGEEMKALGLRSARLFCSSLAKQFAQAPEPYLKELFRRFRSIASWMEAQESFSLWLVFKDLRPAWRGDRDAKARAIQACYLSKLPQKCLIKTEHRSRELITARFPEGVRIGTKYDNRPWNYGQWKNILEQAARLTKKRYNCTEFERWLGWCYPVFKRYGWNTRQVQEAAIQRGFTEAREMDEANFRRRLISKGLPISGRKQKRRARAPLAEFVEHVVLPDPETMWSVAGGFLTKKN